MTFNLKTKLNRCIFILFSLALLTGCEYFSNSSLRQICKKYPELCDQLHVIGDCRYQRTAVIRALYNDKVDANEINKQAALTELEEYETCLELTLFIQYTRNKERKKYRMENYLKTQSLIKENVAESKGTHDPMLAYYLWTHHHDMAAREVFLAEATKKHVTDPKLLLKLAFVYTKDNPQEAIKQFYKAMRSTKSIKELSASTFAMIMTIFYQNKNFEEAYVWALITYWQDEEEEYPINLDMILRKGLSSGDKLITNEDELEAKAEKYYKQLKEGKFNKKAPKLR